VPYYLVDQAVQVAPGQHVTKTLVQQQVARVRPVADRVERDGGPACPVVAQQVPRDPADLLLCRPRPEDSLAGLEEVRVLAVARTVVRQHFFRSSRFTHIDHARPPAEDGTVPGPEVREDL
jgi:hypothetical protein